MKTGTVISRDDVIVDAQSFIVTLVSSGRVVGVKQKFEHKCMLCSNVYNAALCFERVKKHAWHCRSCAVKLEWSTSAYRDEHQRTLKAAHGRTETRERHGRASRVNWEKADVREPMIEAIRTAHRTPEYREAAQRRGREAFLRDPARFLRAYASRQRGHYTKSDGSCVYLKSSYEFRFARLMDAHSVEWVYEPCAFVVAELGCGYVPDFYIEQLDMFVEVKGYFYADALKKWHAFLVEHKDIKISLVTRDILMQLEAGESLESCLKTVCR